jgi:hypothetical protein
MRPGSFWVRPADDDELLAVQCLRERVRRGLPFAEACRRASEASSDSLARAFGPPFLFDSGNGVVRAFSSQKVPKCDWHGPRSHINRVWPIKTPDQVPAEIVQIGIEDGGNLRPLFVVAKNLAMANYSDILAGIRIDDIAVEHVFLFCVSDVTFTTPNSTRCSGAAAANA